MLTDRWEGGDFSRPYAGMQMELLYISTSLIRISVNWAHKHFVNLSLSLSLSHPLSFPPPLSPHKWMQWNIHVSLMKTFNSWLTNSHILLGVSNLINVRAFVCVCGIFIYEPWLGYVIEKACHKPFHMPKWWTEITIFHFQSIRTICGRRHSIFQCANGTVICFCNWSIFCNL